MLNTIFASVAVGVSAHAASGAQADAGVGGVDGYRVVFLVAAGTFALAALIAAALMRRPSAAG